MSDLSLVSFIDEVCEKGHSWGEVEDFCQDSQGLAIFENVTSLKKMKDAMDELGIYGKGIRLAGVNTWKAYKGLER